MKIYCKEKLIFNNAKYAKGFFKRLLGLMFKKKLKNGEALILVDSNWLHTFFMKFEIDVIYLDSNFECVEIHYNKKPGLILPPVFKAKYAIEFASLKTDIKKGDKILIDEY